MGGIVSKKHIKSLNRTDTGKGDENEFSDGLILPRANCHEEERRRSQERDGNSAACGHPTKRSFVLHSANKITLA